MDFVVRKIDVGEVNYKWKGSRCEEGSRCR